jgi:preprotein translocase subunit SecE
MNVKSDTRDRLIWSSVFSVTLVVVALMYAFHFMGPVKALVWLVWAIAVLTLAYFTTQGQKLFVFAKESKAELQKVVWPTRQETVQTTSIVMLMVVITGFILWGVDVGMMWLIGKITHLG